MIDRLQHELERLHQLTPEAQEELALFIAALRESQSADSPSLSPEQPWHDPAGAWSDLPDDDEAATFYRMRHKTSSPFPPQGEGGRGDEDTSWDRGG